MRGLNQNEVMEVSGGTWGWRRSRSCQPKHHQPAPPPPPAHCPPPAPKPRKHGC